MVLRICLTFEKLPAFIAKTRIIVNGAIQQIIYDSV